MYRPPTWLEAFHAALDARATCRHTKGQIPCGRFDCLRCRGAKAGSSSKHVGNGVQCRHRVTPPRTLCGQHGGQT
jgi:hypothetical protein